MEVTLHESEAGLSPLEMIIHNVYMCFHLLYRSVIYEIRNERGGLRLFGWALIWFFVFCIFVFFPTMLKMALRPPPSPPNCLQCHEVMQRHEKIGRRQILSRLLEARTPNEAWDDIKIMAKKDGAQTKDEEQRRPRWEGFKRNSKDKEFSKEIRIVFATGRNSIIRELTDEQKSKEWLEIVRSYKRSGLDTDWNRGDPPSYTL